jgi:hypothetical protein
MVKMFTKFNGINVIIFEFTKVMYRIINSLLLTLCLMLIDFRNVFHVILVMIVIFLHLSMVDKEREKLIRELYEIKYRDYI